MKHRASSIILALAFCSAVCAAVSGCAGSPRPVRAAELGFAEKQAELPDGSVINYAEGPDNGLGLLLIHGQTGAWEDYAKVLPKLSKRWHVFAVDCYGHGKSSHDPKKYYIKENGDDLVWFIRNVIGERTVVSGHSSGALLCAYIAGRGAPEVVGALPEDPPVFSTEKERFPSSFAYIDTYKVFHDYLRTDRKECLEAYYLRRCYWGQLYMAPHHIDMNKLADEAQKSYEKNPAEPVRIPFMPESVNGMFTYWREYDPLFGDHYYDSTWQSGISHEDIFRAVKVPAIFLHAKDDYTADGKVLLAASSDADARRAVSLMADCELIELKSGHDIHAEHPDVFIAAIDKLGARVGNKQ